MLLGLYTDEFAILAADGEFGLGGLQIGLYARDGGVQVLLGEFAFPDGDDSPGEGVSSAVGVVRLVDVCQVHNGRMEQVKQTADNLSVSY